VSFKTIYLNQFFSVAAMAMRSNMLLLVTCLLFTAQVYGGEPFNGKYIERYTTGTVKVKGYFKAGKKHYNWFYYSEKGVILKRERYKADTLLVVYAYNEKGKLASITDKNGKITYKWGCGCQ
jgi:hypothetical protein